MQSEGFLEFLICSHGSVTHTSCSSLSLELPIGTPTPKATAAVTAMNSAQTANLPAVDKPLRQVCSLLFTTTFTSTSCDSVLFQQGKIGRIELCTKVGPEKLWVRRFKTDLYPIFVRYQYSQPHLRKTTSGADSVQAVKTNNKAQDHRNS